MLYKNLFFSTIIVMTFSNTECMWKQDNKEGDLVAHYNYLGNDVNGSVNGFYNYNNINGLKHTYQITKIETKETQKETHIYDYMKNNKKKISAFSCDQNGRNDLKENELEYKKMSDLLFSLKTHIKENPVKN